MKASLLCGAVVLFSVGNAHAAPVQWTTQDGGDGHYYELVGSADPSQEWSWQESNTMAQGMSYIGMPGHLVTIGSAAEEQFITDTFYANYTLPMWIGLTDDPAYGGYDAIGTPDPQVDGWVWVTGEPVAYTDWSPNEPANVQANSDYVAIGAPLDSHPTWSNYQSGTGGSAAFLVEFQPVPEPSSLVLVCTGAMVALAWLAAGRRDVAARCSGSRPRLGRDSTKGTSL